jgi:hypothetical protein
MPFKSGLAFQNKPLSKHNSKSKMMTSLEVFNIICLAYEPTKRRALSIQEVELEG